MKALDHRIILFSSTMSSGSALFIMYARHGCIQVSSIIMTSSGSVALVFQPPSLLFVPL
jgi:hypothetical protein